MKEAVGDCYLIASVGLLIGVVSWLVVISSRMVSQANTYPLLGFLFLGVGLLGVLMTALACADTNSGEYQRLALQQFVFGYLVPVGIGWAILTYSSFNKLRVWVLFFFGY